MIVYGLRMKKKKLVWWAENLWKFINLVFTPKKKIKPLSFLSQIFRSHFTKIPTNNKIDKIWIKRNWEFLKVIGVHEGN